MGKRYWSLLSLVGERGKIDRRKKRGERGFISQTMEGVWTGAR